jgi:hypothetical protein
VCGVVFDTRWMQRLLSFLVTETLPSIKIRYAFAYSLKKTLLQLVVLNACHFGPECHDLRSELVIVL